MYAKRMQELEQMVERMILESLGLEKYFQSHIESLEYAVRLSEYGVPLDRETKIAMQSHVDPNMITIIAQHEVGGLEVQAEDGSWIAVEPSPDSFVVMTGEAFAVRTNGRLPPCRHRVRITGEKKRYSALFSSRPKDGCVVQVPEELVDDEHPLLYKPCDYNEYIKFRFSEEGKKVKDTLASFCGAKKEEIAA
ncbi:putative 2-oxoglutarate-dependent dioxygenase AOP1.2 [Ananas comosus]|uniref:Putative 2-oxoglutarate-dependent dioxygenase AOP1.2 n=1 Tax=Ananas comosus TaxID=4615 RepID=A0A199WA37_ANACO|nr:putative 2-oxoglutarate-dependent dioxygenase AOP1.2 [Ananas comosus]